MEDGAIAAPLLPGLTGTGKRPQNTGGHRIPMLLWACASRFCFILRNVARESNAHPPPIELWRISVIAAVFNRHIAAAAHRDTDVTPAPAPEAHR